MDFGELMSCAHLSNYLLLVKGGYSKDHKKDTDSMTMNFNPSHLISGEA